MAAMILAMIMIAGAISLAAFFLAWCREPRRERVGTFAQVFDVALDPLMLVEHRPASASNVIPFRRAGSSRVVSENIPTPAIEAKLR